MHNASVSHFSNKFVLNHTILKMNPPYFNRALAVLAEEPDDIEIEAEPLTTNIIYCDDANFDYIGNQASSANAGSVAIAGSVLRESLYSQRRTSDFDQAETLEKSIHQTEHRFRVIHHVAITDQPIQQYIKTADLMERCGADLGPNCRSAYTANEMLDFLAKRYRKLLIQHLQHQSTMAVSLLLDESTDFVHDKQLCLLFRTIKNGRVRTVFYRLVPLLTNFEAQTMYNEITRQLEKDGIGGAVMRQKLIGLGADGASVISGSVAGLGVLLKQDYPNLFRIHCAAHRVGLVGKDLVKGHHFSREHTIIKQVKNAGYMFTAVPLVKNALLNMAAENDMFDVVNYRPVQDNRWVSHFSKALRAFVHNIKATIMVCREHGALHEELPRLGSFLRNLVNIFCCAAMLDVVAVLGDLNLILQLESLTVKNVIDRVQEAKVKLDNIRNASEPTGELLAAVNKYDWRTDCYEDQLLATASGNRPNFEQCKRDAMTFRKRIADVATKCLANRFPDDETMTLISEFCSSNGADSNAVRQLASLFGVSDASDSVLANKVKDIVNVLPPTSVDCERLFSHMTRILTADRNKLLQETLDDLLFFSFNGPETTDLDKEMPAIIKEWRDEGHHLASAVSERSYYRKRKSTEDVVEKSKRVKGSYFFDD